MAFQGYLIKFGDTIMPNKYIQYDSYTSTPRQVMDLEAWRDGDGTLHRNTLQVAKAKVEWETPHINDVALSELLGIIDAAITNTAERQVEVTFWDDQAMNYRTMTAYMPDVQYKARTVQGNTLWYNPIRFALIEY